MGNNNKNQNRNLQKEATDSTGIKEYKSPSRLWFSIRVFFLCVISLVFFLLLFDYLKERDIIPSARDIAGDSTYYDSYYYKKEYISLRDLFYLYNIPDDEDEVYGKYWEMIHAFEHYLLSKDYAAAYRAGVSYADTLAKKESDALKKIVDAPVFSENGSRLND